jgi:hypothetical protein
VLQSAQACRTSDARSFGCHMMRAHLNVAHASNGEEVIECFSRATHIIDCSFESLSEDKTKIQNA